MSIEVIPGSITIEGIRGRMEDSSWVLYISTLEKYVAADCSADGHGTDRTMVCLYPDERTRRAGELLPPGDYEPTVILLPAGYACEACRGRYTVRVIGVWEEENPEYESLDWTEV